MHFKYVALVLGFMGTSQALPQQATPQPTQSQQNQNQNQTARQLFKDMQHKYEAQVESALSSANGTCTGRTVAVRKSWDALTTKERREYIKAVKCLHAKPSRVDKLLAPSARVRADDFTYQHIIQTNFAHGSGLFLPWHRQFVHRYEAALRDECCYKGRLPYWDWLEHSADQAKAPVFDDGPAGFGGNGLPVPGAGTSNVSLPDIPGPFYIQRDAGTGGGCVTTGAFANMSVHLGPVAPARNPASDVYGLANPPHCLARDFNQAYSATGLTYDATNQLLASPSYEALVRMIDRLVHGYAHKFLGGDGYDFYSSPSDPVFFLLHGQIDRLWTIWQAQDQAARERQAGGTVTFMNMPRSANATLESRLVMGDILGGDVLFGDVVSPVKGDFCYRYE